jgi:Peptidase_C39 like family
MSEAIESFVEAKKDTLRAYCIKGRSLNIGTRTSYYSQRDNYTMPGRTCNASANAMWLDWVLRATGRSGLDGDNQYLRTVLEIGDTIYHENQTAAIKKHGFNSTWRTDADHALVDGLVDAGIPVVVNILHRGKIQAPRGGHIILLCGKRGDSWIAQDPYGTLISDYSEFDGKYSRIGDREFLARWQGGYRVIG